MRPKIEVQLVPDITKPSEGLVRAVLTCSDSIVSSLRRAIRPQPPSCSSLPDLQSTPFHFCGALILSRVEQFPLPKVVDSSALLPKAEAASPGAACASAPIRTRCFPNATAASVVSRRKGMSPEDTRAQQYRYG